MQDSAGAMGLGELAAGGLDPPETATTAIADTAMPEPDPSWIPTEPRPPQPAIAASGSMSRHSLPRETTLASSVNADGMPPVDHLGGGGGGGGTWESGGMLTARGILEDPSRESETRFGMQSVCYEEASVAALKALQAVRGDPGCTSSTAGGAASPYRLGEAGWEISQGVVSRSGDVWGTAVIQMLRVGFEEIRRVSGAFEAGTVAQGIAIMWDRSCPEREKPAFPAELEIRLIRVINAMPRSLVLCPDGTDFPGYLQVLCAVPFNAYLPPIVQDALPAVLAYARSAKENEQLPSRERKPYTEKANLETAYALLQAEPPLRAHIARTTTRSPHGSSPLSSGSPNPNFQPPMAVVNAIAAAAPEPGEAPRTSLLRTARGLFRAFDLNGSGRLDYGEVALAASTVLGRVGRPREEAEVPRLVRQALGKHDLDQCGTMSLPEFVRVLTKKPWCCLLHPETQFLLDLHDAPAPPPPPSGEDDGRHNSKIRTPTRKQEMSAGELRQELLASARQLFRRHVRTTSQGGLSPESLANMYRSAVPDKEKANLQVEEAVLRAFAKCDVNQDGEIAFGEFIRLITRRPWRNMLPESTREALDGEGGWAHRAGRDRAREGGDPAAAGIAL